jgi:hypothetical protein
MAVLTFQIRSTFHRKNCLEEKTLRRKKLLLQFLKKNLVIYLFFNYCFRFLRHDNVAVTNRLQTF